MYGKGPVWLVYYAPFKFAISRSKAYTSLVFGSYLIKNWFSSDVINGGLFFAFFVDRRFCLVFGRWPLCVSIVSFKCSRSFFYVNTVHEAKKSCWIASSNVDLVGEYNAVCKNCTAKFIRVVWYNDCTGWMRTLLMLSDILGALLPMYHNLLALREPVKRSSASW